MSDLPDPEPLVDFDGAFFRTRRYTDMVCQDANNLCRAINQLADCEWTEDVFQIVNRAVTACTLAAASIKARQAQKTGLKVVQAAE